LARVTKPTQGFADVRGRMGSLLEVGTGFHPELTGRENVFLNGAILGMSKSEIQRKFDEIVAFAEVEKFIDTPLKHYSTGVRMRLLATGCLAGAGGGPRLQGLFPGLGDSRASGGAPERRELLRTASGQVHLASEPAAA